MCLFRTISEKKTAISVENRKIFQPLCILNPSWRGFPGIVYRRWGSKTRMMGLPGRERDLTISWIPYTNVTDGRTDTGRQQRPHLRIASCGKNVAPHSNNTACLANFSRIANGVSKIALLGYEILCAVRLSVIHRRENFGVSGQRHRRTLTGCRRAAATICPRPSPPSVGAEAPSAAEHTATYQ